MAYQHKEAFALMWYACPCGHCERVWNSRDGVTPFCMPCPSCGDSASLQHVAWQQDVCRPDHKPHRGQRMFVNLSRDRAHTIASLRMAYAATTGARFSAEKFKAVVGSIYRDGTSPDVQIAGYAEGGESSKDGAPDRTT